MVKLLAFLGTAEYKPTTYRFEDREETTCYFPVAAAKLFQPDQVFIFATEAAEEKHRTDLCAAMEGNVPVEFIPIEEGRNEQELWKLFAALTETLQEGDEVIFDVTLGFRSIPILATIAAAFIQVARDVQLSRLIYGAWEARDSTNVTPVFDLTPFLTLLDWTTATHLFLRTGNADELAARLRLTGWAEAEQIAALDEATAALRLARPDEARERAYSLSQTLAALSSTSPDAAPFGLLLRQVREEFGKIAKEPVEPTDLTQQLRDEYALIEWNFQRGQLLSAITVAREWLVSLTCWRTRPSTPSATEGSGAAPFWREKAGRKKAEKVLGSLGKLASLDEAERGKLLGSQTPSAQLLWQEVPRYAEQLGLAWNLVSNLRNDLNHAGMVHTTETRSLTQALTEIEQSRALLASLYEDSALNSSARQPQPRGES